MTTADSTANGTPDTRNNTPGGARPPRGPRPENRERRAQSGERNDRGPRRGPPREGGENGPRFRRPVDDSPPRFNVDELAAIAGPPVWQAVHEAVITDVTDVAVFLDVKPHGQDVVRAIVAPTELGGLKAEKGALVRARLLDPPTDKEPVAHASVRQARELDLVDRLTLAVDKGEGVPGVVVREVKGGFSVALFADDDTSKEPSVRAFLPSSQATLSRFGAPKGGYEVVGLHDTFDITEFEAERANVVVSRKRHLVKEKKQKTAEILAGLKEGSVVSATVKSILPYGAFLQIAGTDVDGLLHASDLAWEGRPHVEQILKLGQTVDVQIIGIQDDGKKLKFGLKQLKPDPWGAAKQHYPTGAIIEGVVVALADFGAFVKLGDGVEGLIHVSELSYAKVKHPSQKLQIGATVKVKVLGMDLEHRRISLSTKALEKNPFDAVAERFPVGTVVKAKVKSLTDFGAFVELADGVDGLVHVGEISWTEHVDHPSQLLTVGQEVEAVVIEIQASKGRIGCSIKRAHANPFDAWEKKYAKGSHHKLKVARVDERGAWLEVEAGLTCFCPTRDLVGTDGSSTVERAIDAVKHGTEIEVEVKAFDRRFKKVSVSARAVVEGETREAYDAYQKSATGDTKLNSLGDKLKALADKKS
jgi:small subunit ribosomal protein S1